jgi:hypothetical protein
MISIPIYVTRKHGHENQTGAFSLSPGLFLLTCTLVWLNVLGWSAYGLYALVAQVVSNV